MNVSIRRQGITIKTVAITGSRVRVGSGPECEIQLNDPFLAAVVAELVRRGAGWHVVDSGTSLDGVTKDGIRVLDEPIAPGEPYAVGAFELVADAIATRPPLTRAEAASSDAYIPMTMVESLPGHIPRTTVQPLPQPGNVRAGSAGAAAAPQKIVFAPAPSKAAAPAALSLGIHAQKRRILLVILVAVATAVMTIALVVGNRSTVTRPPVAETVGVLSTVTTPTAPAVNGDALAKNLEIEKAFAAWEAQVAASPAASSALQQRIADGAFELARAYAATNDSANARRYYEKVVWYGVPESENVRYARARLQPQ